MARGPGGEFRARGISAGGAPPGGPQNPEKGGFLGFMYYSMKTGKSRFLGIFGVFCLPQGLSTLLPTG